MLHILFLKQSINWNAGFISYNNGYIFILNYNMIYYNFASSVKCKKTKNIVFSFV